MYVFIEVISFFCSHASALTRLESCEVKCGGCSMRLRLWSLNTGRQSFICSDTGLVSSDIIYLYLITC